MTAIFFLMVIETFVHPKVIHREVFLDYFYLWALGLLVLGIQFYSLIYLVLEPP